MTRIGILSDIHGNLHALRAVLIRLHDLEPDQIVCLGDVVGYGPYPAQCIELVTEHCAATIRGNHEDAVLAPRRAGAFNGAARQAVLWTRRRLSPGQMKRLRDLPAIHLPHPTVMCVHDSPVPGPTDYVHDHRMAALAFRGMEQPICLLGHTHVPAVFEAPPTELPVEPDDVVLHQLEDGAVACLRPDHRYICNPGSVGQPRDYDPRAAFGVLDLAVGTFTVHRVEYDVDAAQAATRNAGLPPILADRLAVGV